MSTVVATGTTPAGTAYSIYEEANGVDTVQWGVADSAVALPNLHGMLYCHGSGGDYDQFNTISAFNNTKYGIIDNGSVWVQTGGSTTSVYNGQNNWGRNAAKTAYSSAAQIVAGHVAIADWVILGRSMGGIIGKWLFTQDSYLAPISLGYLDVSGIYSMLNEFDGQGVAGDANYVAFNHFDLPHWYSTTEPTGPSDPNLATIRASLANNTITNDPARFSVNLWAGKQVCVVYGTADTTAVPSIAALKFWGDISSVVGSDSSITPVAGATHSQTGGTYDSPAILAFMRLMWGYAPPSYTPGYKIDGMYFVAPNNNLYPLQPVSL